MKKIVVSYGITEWYEVPMYVYAKGIDEIEKYLCANLRYKPIARTVDTLKIEEYVPPIIPKGQVMANAAAGEVVREYSDDSLFRDL